MPKRSLHVVPDDKLTPYPVDKERLKLALQRAEHAWGEVGPGLQVEVEGTRLDIQMLGDGGHISVAIRWNTDLPYSEVEYALFAAADSWNRDSHFPTIYTEEDAGGAAVVVAAFTHVAGAGLTDEQLDHVLETGIHACIRAANYMLSVSHTILQLPPGANG